MRTTPGRCWATKLSWRSHDAPLCYQWDRLLKGLHVAACAAQALPAPKHPPLHCRSDESQLSWRLATSGASSDHSPPTTRTLRLSGSCLSKVGLSLALQVFGNLCMRQHASCQTSLFSSMVFYNLDGALRLQGNSEGVASACRSTALGFGKGSGRRTSL